MSSVSNPNPLSVLNSPPGVFGWMTRSSRLRFGTLLARRGSFLFPCWCFGDLGFFFHSVWLMGNCKGNTEFWVLQPFVLWFVLCMGFCGLSFFFFCLVGGKLRDETMWRNLGCWTHSHFTLFWLWDFVVLSFFSSVWLLGMCGKRKCDGILYLRFGTSLIGSQVLN